MASAISLSNFSATAQDTAAHGRTQRDSSTLERGTGEPATQFFLSPPLSPSLVDSLLVRHPECAHAAICEQIKSFVAARGWSNGGLDDRSPEAIRRMARLTPFEQMGLVRARLKELADPTENKYRIDMFPLIPLIEFLLSLFN